jgi:hypothetical protein
MFNKQKKYFIRVYDAGIKVSHGKIGNLDIEKNLKRNNFRPISFPLRNSFSLRSKFLRFFYLLKTISTIPGNSVVVFQYPLYARLEMLLLKLLRLKRSLKFVCFITDINGIKDGNTILLRKEINFFRQFSLFIVHNDTMKRWLSEKVPSNNISIIEFFDFFATTNHSERKKKTEIAFAGNLEKSGFIEQLPLIFSKSSNLRMHLYGPGFQLKQETGSNIQFEGVVAPYQLPSKIKGSFGLVWDGDSAYGLEGSLGTYFKIISPHKLSLYILSGLPLITHSEAACAHLIKKYRIGFVVNSITEIKNCIHSLSDDEYQMMKVNCNALAERISTGQNLQEALRKLSVY